ncbi:methyltransferase type 11 [Orenia metallireducens]|uniref:Methyltransferase type 11 n=1 Tax=Orenia metallireducens TaxID=1413210 RepID=A0A1C0A6L2_9FIRM|nr:methyltransferase type 11 [Orenia metallireducens]
MKWRKRIVVQRVNLKETERLDDLLVDDLRLIQNPAYFCFSLDAVLLANFASPKNDSKVLDIGTGSGIIPHLMQAKYQVKKIYGIDIQAELIDMAKRSAKYNKVEDKLEFINLNIKDGLEIFKRESFDYIVSNPPYMKAKSGKVNLEDKVAIARHEIECDLEDIIRMSSQLLKYRGKVAYVYRTQRLAELLSLMDKYNLATKRLRLIHSQIDKEAKLFLVEGVKGGGVGLDVLAPLILNDENGNYTEEVKAIYFPEN